MGIKTLGFFLIGAPGDTRATVRETLQFAKSLDLDYVQFSKCLAKPLTPLWKEFVRMSGRDYWSDWILGKEIDRELPRQWTALTNKEIGKLAKWAYIKYHFRLSYIFKHIIRLRSFEEFRRKFYAFLDMFLDQEEFSREDKDFKVFNENRKRRK